MNTTFDGGSIVSITVGSLVGAVIVVTIVIVAVRCFGDLCVDYNDDPTSKFDFDEPK